MLTEALIDKARKGDQVSFIRAITAVKDQAYRVAYSYLQDESSSMDAVCNAIEKAFVGIRKLKQSQLFKTWFMRIVINECHAILRYRQRIQVMDSPAADIAAGETRSEDMLDLERLLDQLAPVDRMLIHLKYYAGYTLEEIAEMTKLPTGTVKTKIYNTIKKLRFSLKPQEGQL